MYRSIFRIGALTIVSFLFWAGCTAENSSPPSSTASNGTATAAFTPHHVNAQQAADLLSTNKAVVVLDVRTPKEFARGHIAGATNVNFLSPDFKANLAKLNRNTPYLVHCATGGRSTKSLAVLKALGFHHVYHLDGGFDAWKAAGNPVVK